MSVSRAGSPTRRRIVALSTLVGLLLLAAMLGGSRVLAFIPESDRTMKAIAEVNRVSGRTQALQLDLTMRIGDREPIAQGELIIHPSGLARLELRGYGGRVDRYLLSGAELLGAKDGERLDRPQPMLQPLFLLQASSGGTLRAALETFGVQSQWIGLAPCGDLDCFVIGDPRLAAPPPGVVALREAEARAMLDDPLADLPEDEDEGEDGDEEGPRLSRVPFFGPDLALPEDGRIPRIWVDTQDLQLRRIDRASGVFVILGPIVSFEKLQLPAWFEIHEPGKPAPFRFEVDRAVQVNAPPKAFSRKWLLPPPEDPPALPGAPASGSMPPAPGAMTP